KENTWITKKMGRYYPDYSLKMICNQVKLFITLRMVKLEKSNIISMENVNLEIPYFIRMVKSNTLQTLRMTRSMDTSESGMRMEKSFLRQNTKWIHSLKSME